MSPTKKNLFVSLGTHPQSFTRLLNEINRLNETKRIKGNVFIQAGYTPFPSSQKNTVDFLPIPEFEKKIQECDVFITHAGEGNIGTALKFRKPLIVVPRRVEFNEHTNDHQLEMARATHENGFGIVVHEITQLEEAIMHATNIKQKPLHGYINQILENETRNLGIEPSLKIKKTTPKWKAPTSASIVVASFNGGEPLIKAVNGMLNQDYNGKYEVIVVDDGSFDGKTPDLLQKNFGKNPKVTLIFLPRSGVCKTRNAGIRVAKYETIINMDHDDNPEKDWLGIMMSGFNSPNVGAVSGYGHYGGTSTGFRKDIIDHLGGYDEDYFYYREDTDLSFRVMQLGFEYRKVEGAKWHGDRTLVTPRGVKKILLYTLQRFKYHMNDVLLHKKNQTALCNQFLHVRGKIFVDPIEDFKVATGLWKDPEKTPELSSPRGMTFLPNRGFLSFAFIVMVGLGYTFAIKWARLAGSIKHGHLLI